jgi:hypothetical protein
MRTFLAIALATAAFHATRRHKVRSHRSIANGPGPFPHRRSAGTHPGASSAFRRSGSRPEVSV